MLRVYLNRRPAREDPRIPKDAEIDLGDRGNFVCGVAIPQGHEVVSVRRSGKRIARVDITTRAR